MKLRYTYIPLVIPPEIYAVMSDRDYGPPTEVVAFGRVALYYKGPPDILISGDWVMAIGVSSKVLHSDAPWAPYKNLATAVDKLIEAWPQKEKPKPAVPKPKLRARC